jgi:hypothetical protein
MYTVSVFFLFFYLGDHSEVKTMCMIVSDTDTVLIYEQTKLRWSAKLFYRPCIIARASFKVRIWYFRPWGEEIIIYAGLSVPFKLNSYCLYYTAGVTRLFGTVVGDRRFEVLLFGHRTHDIYGSRKTARRL